MKKSLFLLFVVLCSVSAYACLNASKKLKNGHMLYEEYRGRVPQGHRFYGVNTKLIKELDSLYLVTKDVDYLSDKGYVLIIQGKYQDAINLYLELEKAHPGLYSTASNIGTAYELNGENENALKWIKKAVSLDPSSHRGSEWIHVNILATKVKKANDIDGALLINRSFGDDALPITSLNKDSLEVLEDQLYYQLDERVSFVKPKDKIVAALYFELGNILLLQNDKNGAKEAYIMARDYGYNSFRLLRQRINVADGKNPLSKPVEQLKSNPNQWMYWVSGFAMGFILVFLIIKGWKQNN
jgi:tetratricopeptide (TPR) repeat protein